MEHAVVSHQDWIEVCKVLLGQEKEFSRRREDLAQQRRDLPWEAVTKKYAFEGPDGTRTLVDLFEGRSQLVVYHFMFDPGWDEGCLHCSFWADSFDGSPVHLKARDTTLAAVSRVDFAKIAAYQKRMGWTFAWFSSSRSDFNYDFGVSFTPEEVSGGADLYNFGSSPPGFEEREGISVFFRNESDEVFHTYSTYARGIDMVNSITSSSTWCPRAETSPETRSYGYAVTTSTVRRPMQARGVHHVSINVDDVDAALDFYVGTLGLVTRTDRPDFGFPGAWLDAGSQQVHLIGAPPPGDRGQHFALRVDDLDRAVSELRDRGVKVSDAVPVGTSRQAFLHDPAGNLIELHQVAGAGG